MEPNTRLLQTLTLTLCVLGHVTWAQPKPVECDDIDFPCSCKTLTDIGSEYPLLDIDCSEQELTRIPDLYPLRHARIYKLDLSDNKIRTVNASTFAGLEFYPERKYAVIRLSNNPIEYISPQAFRGINANEIILEMKNMNLQTFPYEALKHIPTVTQLNLAGNRLLPLPSVAFQGLKDLEILNLDDNPLKVLPYGIFRDQTESLKIIRLKGIGLDELPLGEIVKLKHLEKLVLKDNKISYLPNGMLESLADTVRELELDLSNNQLTEIQYDVFARSDSSRKPIKVVLLLNNNHLQSLSFIEDPCSTMFRVGSIIRAHRNPVTCTCELYSVVLLNYFLIDVYCESPLDYKDKHVYASPKRGLNEVSQDYELKAQQDCTGNKLKQYDLQCIQAKITEIPESSFAPCSKPNQLGLFLIVACLLRFNIF